MNFRAVGTMPTSWPKPSGWITGRYDITSSFSNRTASWPDPRDRPTPPRTSSPRTFPRTSTRSRQYSLPPTVPGEVVPRWSAAGWRPHDELLHAGEPRHRVGQHRPHRGAVRPVPKDPRADEGELHAGPHGV